MRGDFREEDRLQFNGTAFHTSLQDGTMVVTTGLGVIPRGIPVGTIAGLADEDQGWRRSYWLTPMVEPGSVTHVLVATEPRSLPDGVSSGWMEDPVSGDTTIADEEQGPVGPARPGDSVDDVVPSGSVEDSMSAEVGAP